MSTTLECRQPAHAVDEERAHLAPARGQAAVHPIPSHGEPRPPRGWPVGRSRQITAFGRPIETSGLGVMRGAAENDWKAEQGPDDVLAAVAHAARVAMLEGLAASIAQEINEPLAAIAMNGAACTRWLDREVPDLAEVARAARRITADAGRAAEVVRLLGALSRNSAPEFRLLNINDLATEAIPLLRGEAASHGAKVRLDLQPDLPPVAGDRRQLQQVVISLVVNGLRAMAGISGRARSLTIRTQRHRGHGVLASVIDSGTGIDSTDPDTLFSASFAARPGGRRTDLSICRSIIDAFGGDIWASNNQDFGATFHFTLPEFSAGCDG